MFQQTFLTKSSIELVEELQRKTQTVEFKLLVTIHYLSTTMRYSDLEFAYRCGDNTISLFVRPYMMNFNRRCWVFPQERRMAGYRRWV